MDGPTDATPADEAAGASGDYLSDGGPDESTTPPRSPRRRLLLVAAVVVAVAVVLAPILFGIGGRGGLLTPAGNGAPPVLVRVSELTLNFTPGSNPCFSSEYQTTRAETVDAGGSLLFNVTLQDGNPSAARACTVTSLTVRTAGFTLIASNLPVDVGAGSGTLSFTIGAPSDAFNGSVVVTASVAFQAPDVQVTAQNFSVTGGGGQCGTVGATGSGFSGFHGGTYSDGATVFSISPAASCSVTAIRLVSSNGFVIASTNLPVPLPIDSFASVTWNLQLPSSAFQGQLNYTLTLSVT